MTDVDVEGRSRLHYVAIADDVDQARALIARGADPSLGDRKGFTPLHLAAQEGALRVAELLLDAGADVDPANSSGNTPLFVAVFNARGRGDLIALLRAHGADPLRVNAAGQTPAGLARLIGNYDVAQFFADIPS
jgi:ankyrin repeat protein